MNLRKHVAGFALFSVIVGCAIFINAFFTVPQKIVSSMHVSASPSQPPLEDSQPVNFAVRLVTVDFNTGMTYTTLAFKRQAGQPLPERLWVTTVFSSSENQEWEAISTVEINQPFTNGNQAEITASRQCDFCSPFSKASTGEFFARIPTEGYFARVYVSTTKPDKFNLRPHQFGKEIPNTVPVVIQWRQPRSDAYTF
jgi:hypothetical protein